MSDITITEFRNNIKTHFQAAENNPIAVYRGRKVYVLMCKQHYVDLLNKAKYPNLMQMPANVQTVVHFYTTTAQSTH